MSARNEALLRLAQHLHSLSHLRAPRHLTSESRKVPAQIDAETLERRYLPTVMRYGGLAIADAAMLNASAIKGRQLEISRVKTRKKVSVKLPQFRDQHLRRVFEAAGVKGTPHQLRHTFVHNLPNDGWSMREVAAAIGDKPSTVEKYYSKWNVREQEVQNKRMDETHAKDPLLTELSTKSTPANVVPIQKKRTKSA